MCEYWSGFCENILEGSAESGLARSLASQSLSRGYNSMLWAGETNIITIHHSPYIQFLDVFSSSPATLADSL